MDRKYIDASIFLQGILRDDPKFKSIILRAGKKEFLGVTSVLSWDEIVFITRKFLGKDIARVEGDKFFRLPNILFVDANKNIITKAQKLVEGYGLKPRDAIHAASAIINDCSEIISDDSDFNKIKELKLVKP